jgi:GxxExxY protein
VEFPSLREGNDRNEIGKVVVDAAITLHKELGSGLLETVYEVILARELERRGLKVQRQVKIPIEFDGINSRRDSDLILLSKIR